MQVYYNLIKKQWGGRCETKIIGIVQFKKWGGGSGVGCEPRIEGIVQFIKKTEGGGVGVYQELKVLYNLKKTGWGSGGCEPRIEHILQFIMKKGAAIFVYIVLPNSQQSQNFGNPGEPKVSHVYAKHTP